MPYRDKKDYNEFMRGYMKSYRKRERELIHIAKKQLGISLNRRSQKRKKKRRKK